MIRKTTVKKSAQAPKGAEQPASKIALDVRLAHPRPSSDVVQIFAAQCPEARAYALGANTRGPALSRELPAFLKSAAALLDAHGALVDYGADRFAYLVFRAMQLEQAVEAQRHGNDATAQGRTRIELAERAAREARNDLVHKVGEVVEGDEDQTAQLATARGEVNTPTLLADSLDTVVTQAHALVSSRENRWRVLCAAHRLDAASVAAAQDAASVLRRAIDGRSGERTQIDSPAVNLAEGYVAFELGKLWRAIERARSRSKAVRLPTASGELRKVVSGKVHRAAAETPSTGAAAPSDGATGASSGAAAPDGHSAA